MNKPSHPVTATGARGALYDDDVFGWAAVQAAALRERRLSEIDWENVAEEIESVGRQEQGAAESNLSVAIVHILKWRHQPTRRSRSWLNSTREHLRRFDRILLKNPSLKSCLEEMRIEAYLAARADAANQTGLDPEDFPAEPLTWDEIRSPLES